MGEGVEAEIGMLVDSGETYDECRKATVTHDGVTSWKAVKPRHTSVLSKEAQALNAFRQLHIFPIILSLCDVLPTSQPNPLQFPFFSLFPNPTVLFLL